MTGKYEVVFKRNTNQPTNLYTYEYFNMYRRLYIVLI
jgi:hypothetical protein